MPIAQSRAFLDIAILNACITGTAVVIPLLMTNREANHVSMNLVQGEILIFAAWSIFGPGKLFSRLVLGPVLAAAAGALVSLAQTSDYHFDTLLLRVELFCLIHWLVAVLILGFAVSILNYRLTMVEGANSESICQNRQFSIWYLMYLTLFIASGLAVRRVVDSGVLANRLEMECFYRAIHAVLLILPTLLTLLRPESLVLVWPVGLVWLIVVSEIELFTARLMSISIFSVNQGDTNFALYFPVVLNLLLLRAAGYRLTRTSRATLGPSPT